MFEDITCKGLTKFFASNTIIGWLLEVTCIIVSNLCHTIKLHVLMIKDKWLGSLVFFGKAI